MKALSNFLEFRNDVKNIFYLLEDSVSLELLVSLCSKHNIQHLCLAGRNKRQLYSIKNQLVEDSILHLYTLPPIEVYVYSREVNCNELVVEYDAVIFDPKVSVQAILSTHGLKPTYLVGKIWRDCVPYFDIWESFRSVSKHIFLKCVIENNKEEILKWDYNPENEIELSVIFPVYNVGKYLKQCLDSIIAWSAPYVEYLFVNDGSPDNSRDIILEYSAKDPRVKLIDKPNGGCASARKKGLEHAMGRYIGFIDPDDFIDKEMFKKLLSRAMLGSYDVCYCGYNAYYENSKKIEQMEDTIRKPYSNGISDSLMIKQLIMFARVAIWRGIYSHEFLNANKITFNESFRRFDDLPFKVEVFSKAKSFVTVPEFLYYYRLERPGQDMACNDERLYVHFDIFEYLNKKMGELNNQRLFDYLQICKIQTHCFALQKIERKFAIEYARRAKMDFKTNHMTIMRTLLLIGKYIGIKRAIPYLAVMLGMVSPYLNVFDYRAKHKGKKLQSRREQTERRLSELWK